MTRKPKVLFVADTTSHDDCSAVQRFRVLKAGLEKLGAQADILFLADYPVSSPRVLLAANMPLFLEKVRQYDFVHAAGLSLIALGLAKPFADYKIVCDIHGSTEEYRMNKTSQFDFSHSYQVIASEIAWRMAKKKADWFVTVSEPLRQKMLKDGVQKKRTELIYNGVDTNLFKPCSREQNETFTVTYAGAYQKWQGVENLVDAAELLRTENIKFRFFGFQKHDFSLKEAIKAELKDKAELFDYKPRVANEQPRAFVQELCQSDVLIIPRYWNPAIPLYCNPEFVRTTFGWLPTKFAEYTATGRPVIVTNLDAAAEFVEKTDCGFVCNADPKSLAGAILEAKNAGSKELDEKGMKGRRLAEEEFDLQVIGKRYFDGLTKIP